MNLFPIPQDEHREIWYANRLLLLLHPQEPFSAWARQFKNPGEGTEELTAAIEKPFPFLVPLSEDESEVWSWVRDNHFILFDTALWTWIPEPTRWPEDRSWDVFNEWFALEVLDPPWDVVTEPLHSNPPPAQSAEWD